MQLDQLASVALLKPWIISKISLHQGERNGLVEDLLKGSLTKKKSVMALQQAIPLKNKWAQRHWHFKDCSQLQARGMTA